MTDTPRRAFLQVARPAPFDGDTGVSPGDPAAIEAAADAAFGPRDHGTMRADARRALVQLVRGPYVMRQRHPNLWSALESDEAAIRRSLGDLFLDLIIDREAGLAFSRNLETDQEVPKMLRSTPLTLIDTALILFLRDLLLRGTTGRVFVGRDEIDDQLAPYGQAARVDQVALGKRIGASVEKMKKNSILQTTGEEERYEISPILRLIFDASQVSAVTAELVRLVQSGSVGDAAAPEETDLSDDAEEAE